MPAAGRKDGKYVKKVHWDESWLKGPPWRTRCGKHVWQTENVTQKPNEVTCKVCRKSIGQEIE